MIDVPEAYTTNNRRLALNVNNEHYETISPKRKEKQANGKKAEGWSTFEEFAVCCQNEECGVRMNRDYNAAAAAMNIRQNLIYWMDHQGTFNPIFQQRRES